MATTIAKQKERLRQYLNPSIRGPNVDNVLESLASGAAHLIDNVEAINNQLYIVKASGRYLDARMADSEITRPDNIGLSDEVFREIGIEVVNRKQVRDLIGHILEIMYGEEFSRATASATEIEPYALEDGDTLIIQYDDGEQLEIPFATSQFTNIGAATAQEVSDAITKNIRKIGGRGSALAKDDGVGGYVMLISETIGPSSTIKVLGGKAQNKLKFNTIRPTSGAATTQWTLTQVSGGKIRATWTGGPNPSLGRVVVNDYTTIYGTAFNSLNRGTYTISKVQGGIISEAYVEYENQNGVPEVVVQGTDEAFLFFNPTRSTLSTKQTFAAIYQTESRLLEVFMPATTKVIRRERQGAAHLHETGASETDQYGPYIFDIEKPYIIGAEECFTQQVVDSNSEMIILVDDSSEFPDESGNLVFGFGTSKEEGPVPYISRPSGGSLMINPSYRFENIHEIGTDIALIDKNYQYAPTKDGSDYPFYITDTVSGRFYAEDLINSVAATGINVVITILYPGDIGLGKWSTVNSEREYVWGDDPS